MDRGIVSGRYAKALLMYAEKHNKGTEVYREAKWLSRCMMHYPQVKRILSSPVVSDSQKQTMLEELFVEPPSEEFRNFIRLILEKKREESLQTICFMYMDYFREERNILVVELVTAIPVSEESKKRIIEKMGKFTQKQIKLVTYNNPELLGGYVIYWDTYRWDASIASRMRQVKKKIRETMNNI